MNITWAHVLVNIYITLFDDISNILCKKLISPPPSLTSLGLGRVLKVSPASNQLQFWPDSVAVFCSWPVGEIVLRVHLVHLVSGLLWPLRHLGDVRGPRRTEPLTRSGILSCSTPSLKLIQVFKHFNSCFIFYIDLQNDNNWFPTLFLLFSPVPTLLFSVFFANTRGVLILDFSKFHLTGHSLTYLRDF